MIGSEQLFNIVKKRNKSIVEVSNVVARTIPNMSDMELKNFALYLEEELKRDKKFREYWTEVLDLAYQNPEFRRRFETDKDGVTQAHECADRFVNRIHIFVNDLTESFMRHK